MPHVRRTEQANLVVRSPGGWSCRLGARDREHLVGSRPVDAADPPARGSGVVARPAQVSRHTRARCSPACISLASGPTTSRTSSWREMFIPMASVKWRPGAVTWGVVAMYAMIAIQLTSWIMRAAPKVVAHHPPVELPALCLRDNSRFPKWCRQGQPARAVGGVDWRHACALPCHVPRPRSP